MKEIHLTKSAEQTQEIGEDIARKIIVGRKKSRAVVIGLKGDLGGGKTTFAQGFAKGLGIKDKILSPTFVILKRFQIKSKQFKNFYHIDCYRLKNEKDLLELGFKEIISDPENIVLIEWPEKIKKIMPKDASMIEFDFIDENKRKIKY
ncbi:MAG: tRNA (adenosine(37)-N6)-threonylcarbamoyltransferase complex ATPase subunit type 1 TsaE [Candidatus Nealsonbacteria bacterium]|nr:tRNA (adenosine(37)-N6)-threonylcarbamoyltransferase complex ATPase subunit type 1 TsaE [Candidatus Nealsonbacteria bacterium]